MKGLVPSLLASSASWTQPHGTELSKEHGSSRSRFQGSYSEIQPRFRYLNTMISMQRCWNIVLFRLSKIHNPPINKTGLVDIWGKTHSSWQSSMLCFCLKLCCLIEWHENPPHPPKQKLASLLVQVRLFLQPLLLCKTTHMLPDSLHTLQLSTLTRLDTEIHHNHFKQAGLLDTDGSDQMVCSVHWAMSG